MIAFMAGFVVEDVFLKKAASGLPVSQVLIMFGLGGMAVFGLMAFARSDKMPNPDVLSRPMLIRA